MDRMRGAGRRRRRIEILNAHIIKVRNNNDSSGSRKILILQVVDRKIQLVFCGVVGILLVVFVSQSLNERALIEFDRLSGVLSATIKV